VYVILFQGINQLEEKERSVENVIGIREKKSVRVEIKIVQGGGELGWKKN
jgi:hypothetical protein